MAVDVIAVNDPGVAEKQGYELQICGDKLGEKTPGSVYDLQPASRLPEVKTGEWNT